MPLYVYGCTCGRETEALRSRGTESIACTCGEQAQRASVYATAIGGRQRPPVSERPVDMRQFREASEQLAHEHARAEESAQQPLPPPPLWREAKRKAKKVMAAGITDSLDYRPDYTR